MDKMLAFKVVGINTCSKYVRHFSQNLAKLQNGFPHSNIPMISPLLSNRLLGKSHFISSVDEEAILELLRNISDIPVQKSEYNYVSFAKLKHSKFLPKLPKNLDQISIEKYVNSLTHFQYDRKYFHKISEVLQELVNFNPKLFSKKNYIDIISFFHHISNDKIAFKILNIMIEETEIVQDTDFDNIFLAPSNRPSLYKQKISRLESMDDKDFKANVNTWYNIFDMFKNPEPKIQMLDLMDEYKISKKPLLTSLTSIIDYLTPERLLELYQKNDITLDNGKMDSIMFNQLIACYLKDDRIDETWLLVLKINEFKNSDKNFINIGLFVTYTNYFFKNNQLGYAFAFSQFLEKKYNIKTYHILESMLLNVYLINCPYFDYWSILVRSILSDFKKTKGFFNTKTISNLNDYCDLHNIKDDLETTHQEDKEFIAKIRLNLIWSDIPVFKLSNNSPKFIECSKLLGQNE